MYMHVYNITHIIYMDQRIYMEDRLKSFILLWHFARKASMMVRVQGLDCYNSFKYIYMMTSSWILIYYKVIYYYLFLCY